MQTVFIILFLAALVWLIVSARKKSKLKIPIIVTVATLALALAMPSGDGSGGSDGFGTSANKRDFSSRSKVQAYFEDNLERNYPDAIKTSVAVSSEPLYAYYNSERIQGYYVQTAVITQQGMESFKFLAATDGKIFDAEDMSHLTLLG